LKIKSNKEKLHLTKGNIWSSFGGFENSTKKFFLRIFIHFMIFLKTRLSAQTSFVIKNVNLKEIST